MTALSAVLLAVLAAVLLAGCQTTRPAATAAATVAGDAPLATLDPLRDGVFVHTTERETEGFGRVFANGLVVVAGGDALLVNTGWDADADASTDAILRDVAARTGARVRRAVVSHHHDDSVGGVGALRRAGVPVIGTDLMAELMDADGWGRPDSVLTGEPGTAWAVRYGDREAEVFFPGAGHTADNVVVFFPEARVLFGGCLVRPGESETLGFTGDASIDAWAESVARVRDRYRGRIDVVVPTHGAPAGPELLDHTIRLVVASRHRPLGG